MCLLVAGAVVLSAAWRINQLKPAAPTVEHSAVWIGAVSRGSMVRDVRGFGTLIPEDIQWIQHLLQVDEAHVPRPLLLLDDLAQRVRGRAVPAARVKENQIESLHSLR